MSVDRDSVEYVARLAKLELGDAERDAMAEQLARIVEFVAQLDEVDITDVPPTKHVIGRENVERADEPTAGLPRAEALAAAPDADEGHFVVPKVLPD
jgi:aspartyl-tRNA(Asn)/glutamyl-tRNA(Gln) amidotransferase subunit C